MPRQPQGLHRLSALAIKSITRPGWHGDGGGLFLEVDPSGRKRWAMRLTLNGKRRDFGLGPLHKVSLHDARARAAEYRGKAYAGLDPIAEKRTARSQPAFSSTTMTQVMTFERAADDAHRARKAAWSNGKHVDQWINTLRDHAFPFIGGKAIREIGTPEVLEVLTAIWSTKPETARRVRQRMRTVLEWARAAGHRSGDNPIDLIGDALPKHSRKVAHHVALPYHDVGEFISRLRCSQSEAVTKAAFEYLILTAARTTEVRFASWAEVDLAAGSWTVPARRMKARRDHVVPLSPCAVAILSERRATCRDTDPSDLIFVDPKNRGALSENRFLNARDAIGCRDLCTPHGFRSSFRDWAAEETQFPAEVVEMALAHTIKNKAEAAYRRGDLLVKRRDLMAAWASYVSSPKTLT